MNSNLALHAWLKVTFSLPDHFIILLPVLETQLIFLLLYHYIRQI
jgi:hypothetical protein